MAQATNIKRAAVRSSKYFERLVEGIDLSLNSNKM
jgi:hypothetical protein